MAVDGDLARFVAEWKSGRRDEARAIARAYIDAHRAELAPQLEPYSLDDLVRLVSAYRQAGREEDRIVADMWLLTEYEPQRITGTIHMGGSAAIEAAEAIIREGSHG